MQLGVSLSLIRLGLCMKELRSCEGGNHRAFIDSLTRPCSAIDLSVSFGKGKNKRTLKVYILIIPCKFFYNDILGRSFMETIDIVASTVNLKMKYHNCLSESIVIEASFLGDHLIHETLLNNPLVTIVTFKRRKKNV